MELERIAAPAAQALEVSGIDVPRFVAAVDPRRPGRAAGIAHRVPGVVSIVRMHVRSERGRRRDVARVGITHARLHAAYAALTR